MLLEDQWFYFSGGRKASSLEELKQVLEVLGEDEFRHHVNDQRNDFANWVEGVFGELGLAKNMREVSEKEGLVIILDEFLKKKKQKKARHEKIKRLIIPERKKITPTSEKELSKKEIETIIDDAKQTLEKEEQHMLHKKMHLKAEHHKFVVKEFIYGFVLGLIFGLIMLGIIFNLKF